MTLVKMNKQKVEKRLSQKKLRFEDYKSCLEATQLEEKNEINISSLERDFKEFIKDVKGIMFLLEKRMQSIDLTEIYEYGTSEDLVSKKEGIKCNNIIIQFQIH